MQFTFVCPGKSKLNSRTSFILRGFLLVVLLLSPALFYFVKDVEAQGRVKQSGNLTLIIHPQIQLQEVGTEVILKIRLEQGTNAKLWGDNSCEVPKKDGTTFTASGTYTISVQNLAAQKQAYACAVSSDGLLKASIALKN
jgi:Na+-transporting NADH:ubiquinone oxidoreductase subunit NqrB